MKIGANPGGLGPEFHIWALCPKMGENCYKKTMSKANIKCDTFCVSVAQRISAGLPFWKSPVQIPPGPDF